MEQNNTNSQQTLSFQQAMSRLEKIVEMLNSPSLELEQAMDLFREGLALSKQCQAQLDHFEKEMNELIVENQDGSHETVRTEF